MDFNGICMSSVDFSTIRVEVGGVLQGSSQISQQIAQKAAILLALFTLADSEIKTSTGEPVSEGEKHSPE